MTEADGTVPMSSDVLKTPSDCNTTGQEGGRDLGETNMKTRKSSNDFKGMKGVSTVPVLPSAAADMAWAFQNAATKHLQKRLDRAIQWLADGKTMGPPGSRKPELVDTEPVTIQHVVVCGGVASNQHIRKELTATVEAHGCVVHTHTCTRPTTSPLDFFTRCHPSSILLFCAWRCTASDNNFAKNIMMQAPRRVSTTPSMCGQWCDDSFCGS